MTHESDPEVPARAQRARQYSARYKLRVPAEYEGLDKAGKGALLRRERLYSSLISEWRKQPTAARWRRCPSRGVASLRIRVSAKPRGCVPRTSGSSASWPGRGG